MNAALALRPHAGSQRRWAAALLALVVSALLATPVSGALSRDADELVSVIVRSAGRPADAERVVQDTGGRIVGRIGIISGFVAEIPPSHVARLRSEPVIADVSHNRPVRLLHAVDGYDASGDVGSMYGTTLATGAQAYWNAGYTGKGIDVAVIDSGTAPVNGLSAPGKVIHGPDLSFESQAENVRHLDTYGHGTHMAGIIAGRDDEATSETYAGDHDRFIGMAPDARVVSIKVADARGGTDVSQVIAAIDWVVQHRNDEGMNIRVLNLSFGTDSTQAYVSDPLAYAAEVAWRHGIVVVAAAGNAGKRPMGGMADPAYDPYVIAVAASDPHGTLDRSDDDIASFSSNGDGVRNPDLAAPGKSIASLRVPGSYIDGIATSGQVNDRFFRGSGTSQAAAVMSGAAALVLQQRPELTPDQVKEILERSASPMSESEVYAGAGGLNLEAAVSMETPAAQQNHVKSNGSGSLEGSRGSAHVVLDGVELTGEKDIFGHAFDSGTWAEAAAAGNSWSGGDWNGATWSGATWSGATWSGATWSGATWSGATWSGATWSGATWSGATWSGATWSGATWSGATWSGATWSGATWSSGGWSSSAWA